MVAYTSPDCLPYFEGSDSPCLNTGTVCDPSTVWCDFAEQAEAALTEFDEVITRTATSTPIAWVETTVPFTRAVGDPAVSVQFDTVRMDTDGMVDLDVNRSGFTVNTPGLYTIFGWTIGQTDTSGGSITSRMTATVSPLIAAYPINIEVLDTDFSVIVQDVLVTPNIHMMLPIQAGQSLTLKLSGGGTSGNTIDYTQVSFGIAWMGDLP